MHCLVGAREAPVPTPLGSHHHHRAPSPPSSPAPSSLSSSPDDASSLLLPRPRARPCPAAREQHDPARLSPAPASGHSTPDTSVRSSLPSSPLACRSANGPQAPSTSPPSSPASTLTPSPPRLRPAWLSDQRRKTNRVSVGRRVRIIAPDFQPAPEHDPAHAHPDERRSLLSLSKARWRGYGTLLLSMDAPPDSAGFIDPRWHTQKDKYLRRRALSVFGTGALFLLLTLFLLRELFWLKAPPVEQILVPQPYPLPPSYNASVVRLLPFSPPVQSASSSSSSSSGGGGGGGAAVTELDGTPPLVPRGNWWIQAQYQFDAPASPAAMDSYADTGLLFHTVGVRHQGHVHIHISPEPVGPHPGQGSGSDKEDEEGDYDPSATTQDGTRPPAVCDPRPRATAQLYAFGPHRDQLASSLALAEVLTSTGEIGLTLASDITPWFDARNAITVHVELTLHPGQNCSTSPPSPEPDPDPDSDPDPDPDSEPSEGSASSNLDASFHSAASHSMMAIDVASSRLGVTFHGTPQVPTTPSAGTYRNTPASSDLVLRSLRLSSYYGAIRLEDSVQVRDQVWVQTWFGPLTSTGALLAPEAEVLLHAPYGQTVTLGHVQAASAKVTGGKSDLHIAHLQAGLTDISATSGRINVALKPTGPVYLRSHQGEIDADIDLDLMAQPPALEPPQDGSSQQASARLPHEAIAPSVSEMRIASHTGRITARYRGQVPDVPLHSDVSSSGTISVTHPAMFQGYFNLSADQPVAVSAPLSKQWRVDPPPALTIDGKRRDLPLPGRASRDTLTALKSKPKPKQRKPMLGRTWLTGRSPYGLDEPGWGKSVVSGGQGLVIVAL